MKKFKQSSYDVRRKEFFYILDATILPIEPLVDFTWICSIGQNT